MRGNVDQRSRGPGEGEGEPRSRTHCSEIPYKSAVSDPNGPGNKVGPSTKHGILVGYFMNLGGAWSKDYLVFDLETVHDNKDCRPIRTR